MPVGPSGAVEVPIFRHTAILNGDQIKALPTTAYEIVPMVEGKVPIFLFCHLKLTIVPGGNYVAEGAQLNVQYNTGTPVSVFAQEWQERLESGELGVFDMGQFVESGTGDISASIIGQVDSGIDSHSLVLKDDWRTGGVDYENGDTANSLHVSTFYALDDL